MADKLHQRRKMENSYSNLNTGVSSMLAERLKKHRLVQLKHEFKNPASDIVADPILRNAAAVDMRDQRNSETRAAK